ncbi:MAG TPA: hypothetical protein VK976_12495 [Verrucomicrobiae bacterium]|nr:hypothetical protein [Verrucomicrobiae bacterium]
MGFRSALARVLFVVFLLLPGAILADTAAFDLPGPRVEVRVSRGNKELPIGDVPNLQVGDRLWVHPDLPDSQSAHYLLIVTFLRGSTNPPPESWFTRIETWNKNVKQEGLMVTVPMGAEQALMFLAPETGGDYGTLRNNVRGKPGAFVRASQDLNRAALDRTRLDLYLKSVKQVSTEDPDKLKDESTLLARSLGIKIDDDCFKKPVDEQETCLTQNSNQLVLDDPHSQSMAAQLASGPGADLVGQISATPWAGAGYYSAYVGAIVDVVRLMTSFHTAEYQYIPALALPNQDQLNLQLNAPPSFAKPKSVLVIGLPAIEPPQLPPMHAVDPKGVYCLEGAALVLPVQGAPLVYSTSLGHGWILHAYSKSGASLDLPVKADASKGGFVLDANPYRTDNLDPNPPAPPTLADVAKLGPDVSGTLKGQWGFDKFEGPTFSLRTPRASDWTLVADDKTALIVGRDDTLHLKSDQAACVQEVTVEDSKGKKLKVTHKLDKPDELQVQIALKDATPGALSMQVKQYGLTKLDDVSLNTYAEAGHLDSFSVSAGDHQGVLTGTRLDEVAKLEVEGVQFTPGTLNRTGSLDELQMSAASSADVSALKVGETPSAHVTLKDGRVLNLDAKVQSQRPKVALISKSVQPDASALSPIQLQGDNELPQNATLAFSLKSEVPASFPHDEMIEVGTSDGSASVVLSLGDGTLTLQDSQTVLATLDPKKQLGPSAFGPLHFRPVGANGEKGDWQPLATLVRLPALAELRCPNSTDKQCTLSGSALYLLDSVSTDPQFQESTPVPEGFAGSTLNVPHPNGQDLYVKLRDDRSTVNKLDLPVLPEQ